MHNSSDTGTNHAKEQSRFFKSSGHEIFFMAVNPQGNNSIDY